MIEPTVIIRIFPGNQCFSRLALYQVELISILKSTKMKIFQTIQSIFTMLGIEKPMPSTRIFSINGRLALGFVIFAFTIVTSAMFFIYSAKFIMEYMQCFCALTAAAEIGLCFAAFVRQNQRLFHYIESMEMLINKSKVYFCYFQSILTEFNSRVSMKNSVK